MSLNDKLHDLRALFYEAPSPRVWRELCDAFDLWLDSTRDDPSRREIQIALEYALEHLERWPDGLRVAPRSWWVKLCRSEPMPCWSLVRGVEIGPKMEADDLQQTMLSGLTWLTIHGQGKMNNRAARALSEAEGLDSLKRLRLVHQPLNKGGVEMLLWSPVLNQLDHLDLSGNTLGPREARMLATSTRLAGLETLTLSHNRLLDEGVGVIIEAPHLKLLKHLDLHNNGLTAAGWGMLARAAFVRRAERLDLFRNRSFKAPFAKALARNLDGADTRELLLNGNRFGDEGIAAISNMRLDSLEALDLSQCQLSARGVRTLARSELIDGVKTLELSYNKLGDEGAGALALSQSIHDLVRLDLRNAAITDKGAASLAESPRLKHLVRLDLRGNPITDKGALALAHSTHLPSLEAVILDRRHIREETWRDLVGSQVITTQELTWLGYDPEGHTADLNGRNLDDITLGLIARSKHMLGVQSLQLNHNQITDEGVSSIATSKSLTVVKDLHLSHNKIADKGVAAICAHTRWPLTRINLSHNQFEGTCLEDLLSLPKLTSLNLSHNQIDTHHIQALLDGPLPKSLTHINLSGNPLDDAGLVALLSSSRFYVRSKAPERLHLSLDLDRVSPAGWRTIASSPGAYQPSSTRFVNHPLGDEGVAALALCPGTDHTEKLNLSGCGLTDAAAASLAASEHLDRLSVLTLSHNALTDAGLHHLLRSPLKDHLTALDLSHNQITDEGAHAIARLGLPNLRSLVLEDNQITNEGVQVLTHSAQLPALHSLSLGHNPINDEGVLSLVTGPLAAQLRTLGLKGLPVGSAVLERRHHTLQIDTLDDGPRSSDFLDDHDWDPAIQDPFDMTERETRGYVRSGLDERKRRGLEQRARKTYVPGRGHDKKEAWKKH